MTITIPVAKPVAGKAVQDAVTEVLKSGMLAMGQKVAAFERDFAGYCSAKHGIATNNGTSALHAALACAGIQQGDEVIVPTFSFFATASCVSMCGAKPVFADVDEKTFCIDPDSVNEKITRKTKAILGVHLFGQPFDCKALLEIAQDKNLLLFEDAAQAHGAEYNGRRAGSLGKAGCFSFYPTKNMTTGEGGIITTDDDAYAGVCRRFVNHGQSGKYRHTMIGYNYRLPDIGAAIGLVQLAGLEKNTGMRIANAQYLSENIRRNGIERPFVRPGVRHVYHQNVLRVTDACDMGRQELAESLAEAGIGTAVHYPIPIHMQPVYRELYGSISLPVSERLANEVLSLPVYPGLSEDNLKQICDAINGVN